MRYILATHLYTGEHASVRHFTVRAPYSVSDT